MGKNAFLWIATCALAVVLVAGRCSEDDPKKPTPTAAGGEGELEKGAGDSSKVDAGIEKDPLDGAMTGPGEGGAPLDDLGGTPGGSGADPMLDDGAPEPQPVPEEAPAP